MDPRPDADLRREIIQRVAAVEAAGGDLGRTAGLDDVEVVLRLGLIDYTSSILRRVRDRLSREAEARGIDAELVLAVSTWSDPVGPVTGRPQARPPTASGTARIVTPPS